MSAPGYYLKPDVLAQIPTGQHAVLEASAGTGKTYALEHLVAELVISGQATLEQLLVVTFTEKAAAELRGRVRKLLERLRATTAPLPSEASASSYWCLDDAARARLGDALRRFDSAAICTIHAFCRQALSEHAFANGRLFDEELVDAGEQFSQAFHEVLRTCVTADADFEGWLRLWKQAGHDIAALQGLLDDCAKARGRIVPSWDPGLVDQAFDALPGLEQALEIAEDVGRRDVVGRTQVALGLVYECRERWRKSQGGGQLERYRVLSALHEPSEQLPKTSPVAIDYALAKLAGVADKARKAAGAGKKPNDAFPVHPERSRGALDSARAERSGSANSVSGSTADVAKLTELLTALSAAAPGVEPLLAGLLLPLVKKQLLQRKRQAGLFDFDDMLSLVADSLADAGSPLLAALRQRFRFALIDEFQDTDEVQWRVFRRLFFESPDGHVLYLIGDPKQAIYRFRGADVDTYLAAKREVLAGRAPVYLDQNFRSTQALIDGYNEVLDQKAAPPFFKGEDIRYDRPVTCGKPGFKLVDPKRPAAIHVYVTNAKSASAGKVLPRLGAAIAAEIRRLVSPEAPTVFLEGGKRGRQPLAHRDVYVLCATSKELALVAEQLREENIPFAFYKQAGLFQTVEARHLEAVLEAIADPDSRARRFAAWLTPFFGLALADLKRGADVPETDPLMARLRDWSHLAQKRDYQRLFRLLLEDSGLMRRLIVFGKGERALTNYLQLLEFLREHLASRGATVAEMARELASLRQKVIRPSAEDGGLQRLETERDAVQLLSMHMSKGLEAPVVFLAGGFAKPPGEGDVEVQGLHLPAKEGARERAVLVGGSPQDLVRLAKEEDEREGERLLYVALTRAGARLYLPFVGGVGDAGFAAERTVSGRFHHVNQRLEAILNERQRAGGRATLSELFTVEVLDDAPAAVALEASPVLATVDERLLDAPADNGWRAVSARHAGFITTSFSGMQRSMHAHEEDVEATQAETFDRARPKPEELPGGASSGSFLHEVLAEAPLEAARAVKSAAELGAHEGVKDLFASMASRFGVSAAHRRHALQLIHAALRAPLDLNGVALDGVASAGRVLRELEFLYPIPEEEHPRLGDWPDADERRPFEIRRGFVVGFIDLIFEHQGKTYFGDWKSNCLPDFGVESLEAGFKPYEWQARLYTLALAKLLRLRSEADFDERFGGHLFLFLRGMRVDGAPNEGVVFRRPTWSEVCGWEKELFQRRDLLSRGGA
jgi:exodeoxyribonuclease V beta subunit